MRAFRALLLALLASALTVGAEFAYAQEMHVKDGGTWRQVDEVHVKVSGTWQEVQEGWVRVSGVWQQFYLSSLLNQAVDGESYDLSDSQVGIEVYTYFFVDNDRNLKSSYNSGGSSPSTLAAWLDGAGDPADYEVRVTVDSGANPAGSAIGSWLSCGTDRSWYRESRDGLGAFPTILDVTIRHATDTSDSINFTVTLFPVEI